MQRVMLQPDLAESEARGGGGAAEAQAAVKVYFVTAIHRSALRMDGCRESWV